METIEDFHMQEETDCAQDFCYDSSDLIFQKVEQEARQIKEIRHICAAKETNWSAVEA